MPVAAGPLGQWQGWRLPVLDGGRLDEHAAGEERVLGVAQDGDELAGHEEHAQRVVVRVEGRVDAAVGDVVDTVQVRDRVLEDEEPAVVGHVWGSRRGGNAVHEAVADFEVEQGFHPDRQRAGEGLGPLLHLLAHLPDER